MIKGLTRWLLVFFERQEVVEFVVAVQLWTNRIHQIVHRNYDLNYGKFDQVAGKKGSNDHSGWDWPGLPRMPNFFILYYYFTTAYYVFVLLKNLVPNYLHTVIGWLQLPMEPHCYLLGHFVSHELLEPQLVILFAIYHLTWRSVMDIFQRPYSFSLYVFLTMTERDLEQFYALIETQQDGALSDLASKQEIARKHLDSRRLLRRNFRIGDLKWPVSIPRPADGKQDSSVRVERLFKSALCYKIESNSVIYYKIKPNRTPEARQILRRHLALTALIAIGTLLVAGLTVLTHLPLEVLSVRRYARIYPNCGHNLNSSFTGNLSRPLTWHSLLALVCDSLESFILWSETGYAVVFVWAATHFLNYDTDLYCRRLTEKLNSIQTRIVNDHQTRPLTGTQRQPIQSALAKLDELTSLHNHDDIHESLVEFHHLFRHIQDINLFVSDVLTYTVVIWVSLFVVIGHSPSVRRREFDDPVFVALLIFLELFTYIIFTAGCFSILGLHRHCHRAYKTLCSLMAFDASIHKEGMSRLVEFFSELKGSSYTILQQYPFTRTTYLSIVGWSLSSFFVIDGILSR